MTAATSRRPLRVLVVEDDESDATLLGYELKKAFDPTMQRVETAESMKAALENERWDVIVSDFSLPVFDALGALAVLKASGLDIPLIVVSGTIGEETAVAALHAGAGDFISKGKLARLIPAIDRGIREAKARETLRETEERLRQSQKMDAIGKLAGGVAHDFNNLLSVVVSYAELVIAELPPEDPLRADVGEIRTAGMRAAELTKQLLAFSRKQLLAPRVLDLNDTLTQTARMLGRLIGEHIQLKLVATPGVGKVKVDPGQVEQIIMNLVLNGRDAMPDGGQLTVETSNVDLDEAYARAHPGVIPGPHVMLAVTDTGTGMSKETQERIFEPFYTTKEQGKGTGLGLATVYGIVQQSGGSIWLYSELGRGTTFKVYFPRTNEDSEEHPTATIAPTLRGTETIMLVEDEAQLRVLIRNILTRHGYQVIDAANAEEAIAFCERFSGTVHLLLTDVVMPKMSGRQLAERLAPRRSGMKVLYMSGYTDDTVVHNGVLDDGIDFLQKPITPETLTRKVREAIDRKR